jgi:hypothetical protein
MKRVVVLVFMAMLTGCATQAQQQYRQLVLAAQAASQASQSCLAGLRTQPFYVRLNRDLILEPNDPDTVRKLVNKNRATNEQAADIVEGMRALKPCQVIELQEFGKVHPAYATAIAASYAQMEQDAANLVKKTLTIAEANQRTLARFSRIREDTLRTSSEIVAQYAQAHQFQIQQRQAAIEALQLWVYQQQQLAQQQQLINAMYRPVTTSCNWLGNFLNCTTF